MKNILVVSWFFPPVNSSEGIVTYKLLNNSKYRYDVFTQKNNDNWAYVSSDNMTINDNISYIDSGTDSLDEFKNKAIAYFKENHDKYDIIMTRSMPEQSHMIGLEIKKIKKGIIWIASFGDPIGNNPFTIKAVKAENPYSLAQRYKRPMSVREIFSPKRILKSYIFNRRSKANYATYVLKNNGLQKEIINSCDYVIYNSEEQREYMLKDYSNKDLLDKKSLIIPHSYDSKLYPKDSSDNKTGKINFTFIGHLDDIRTPHVLLEAVNRLQKFDSKIADKAEFNFYGDLGDNDKLYIINNYLFDLIKIRRPVDYLQSLKLMKEADWLIHIDADISDVVDKNIFFAAKVADYIGTQREILGITMINGVSADILRNLNALCLENCADEIFNYLYMIIYKGYTRNLNIEYGKQFDAVNVAKKFDGFIENLER